MAIFKSRVMCPNIKKIQDINDQFDYVDDKPQGKGDSEKVACGQSENYNELKYIYETKLEIHVALDTITEEEAITALCETCHELKNPRSREKFYEKLSEKLNIEIE